MEGSLLTPREVAELLSIRESTLAVWRCSKRYALPYVRTGRRIRYKREHVEQFIRERTVEPVGVAE